MELSAVADDLNEVSVLVNIAHRLLLTIRDDVEASASLQGMVDTLNTAHDQLDVVLETIGSAIDQADAEADRQPREQRPAIH
jgi:short-subunit dehydrogenase involved in D-alanine esterification of teichoic acids